MLNPKSIVSAVCFCFLMTFCASAKADTTYTYNGNLLPSVVGEACEPPCLNYLPGPFFIDGSLTVATPLGDDWSNVFVDPISFSFGLFVSYGNVGQYGFINTPANTYPLSSGIGFNFSTNSSGRIDQWIVNVEGDDLNEGNDILSINTTEFVSDFGLIGGNEAQASNQNDPGTWAVSMTGTGVPESASRTLLIAGLVGLAAIALKKTL